MQMPPGSGKIWCMKQAAGPQGDPRNMWLAKGGQLPPSSAQCCQVAGFSCSSNFQGKDRIKKKKKTSNFYVLATNSGLFKTLCQPNKTCLPVVSSLCFKSVKDQLKHLSQFLRDLHFLILDVSCSLPLLQDCFHMYFPPLSRAVLWTHIRHFSSLFFSPWASITSSLHIWLRNLMLLLKLIRAC